MHTGLTIFIIITSIFIFCNLIIWKIKRFFSYKKTIKPLIEQAGLTYIYSKTPKLFNNKNNPFNPKNKLGVLLINNGAIQTNKTYYRIVLYMNKQNVEKKIWVKIEKSWFHKTKVEFKPTLETFK